MWPIVKPTLGQSRYDDGGQNKAATNNDVQAHGFVQPPSGKNGGKHGLQIENQGGAVGSGVGLVAGLYPGGKR